jgi:uncharacterized protein YdhG (YjbR/CyaY superfamily)
MKNENEAPPTIDAYIAAFPPEVQDILQQVRAVIRAAAPQAVEGFAYRMPAYTLHGPLVYFAAYKNHIGFYPTPSGTEQFAEELAAYPTSKGAVQFPLKRPIPYDLIRRITLYRVEQNLAKAAAKRAPKPKKPAHD